VSEKIKDKKNSQYAKMYLVHVQVARPITTRNKLAYLKICLTSFVTENTKKNCIRTLVSGMARRNA